MMIPQEYDLPDIYRGRDWAFTFRFLQENSDSDPLNLTGWSAKMQIRSAKSVMPGDAPLIIEMTAEIPSPTDGRVIVKLTDTQTAAITEEVGYYDLLLTDTADFDEIPMFGKVKIRGTGTLK